VNSSTLGHVHDHVHIRIVVVVGPAWDFYVLVSHTNIVGVDPVRNVSNTQQRKKGEVERLHFKSSGVAMTVNSTALSSPKVSYAHFRTDRISFTAAIPLLAIKTCSCAVSQNNLRVSGMFKKTCLGNNCVAAVVSNKVGNTRG
jgi:hypothetical protein